MHCIAPSQADSTTTQADASLLPDPSLLAIEAAARSAVGRLGLTEAIQLFRVFMVETALKRKEGSRRAAARVLGITRPAVQHILRRKGTATLRAVDTSAPVVRITRA